MPLSIRWEAVRNKMGAKLILEDDPPPDKETLEKVNGTLTTASFLSCVVVFKHNINPKDNTIFILRRTDMEWNKVCLGVENAIRSLFPETVFKNKLP